MTDYLAFRVCRIAGHVAFWLLIISTLFAGGLTWLVTNDAATAPAALIRLPSGTTSQYLSETGPVTRTLDSGSATTDTSVLTKVGSSTLPDSFPTFSQISMACALVLILAALGEALVIRSQPRRFVTALIPFLVVGILWYATPGARASINLDPEIAFIFVLAAISVREIWFRWAAPTLQKATGTTPVEAKPRE